jgi:hypothetical protein
MVARLQMARAQIYEKRPGTARAHVMLMRIARSILLLLAVQMIACVPPGQYPNEITASYRPSVLASGQGRLAYSAVSFRSERDRGALEGATAVYLGEIEIDESASTLDQLGRAQGRASLECAKRGATHFTLVTSDAVHKHGFRLQTTRAHFAMFRLERARWDALPTELRPEPWVGG